ncbi:MULTISPECIES: hypothetical protein [unclassified Paraflavitalea]|uniref:hypothetical protein n=1 Tax=unclassified Paraflavitalea TaxID=2798305 RepID=UPI003D331D0E
MTTSISKSDFKFEFHGYGHYKVTYTSPKTGKSWTTVTNDMGIIDDTKNEPDPKKKDLIWLKKICKRS